MTHFNKKKLYAAILAFSYAFGTIGTALCGEKINAGVVYEFYLDIQNQITQSSALEYEKLPKIKEEEVNLAYYKDFRPLNMLSMRNTYSVKKHIPKNNYEKIPKEYTISLNTGNISAAAKLEETFEELFANALKFKQKEKYEEALCEIDKAIAKEPLSMEAHFLKADILRLFGKYNDSISEYIIAINIDPYCTDAYFNIAKIFENIDNKELALEYYRYAYTTKPDDYEIRNIILSYEKQGIN